jgi:hypothetical protein
MASDRIKAILHPLPCDKEKIGSTRGYAPDRRRIPSHTENIDGKA